jgi:hypothetical protein
MSTAVPTNKTAKNMLLRTSFFLRRRTSGAAPPIARRLPALFIAAFRNIKQRTVEMTLTGAAVHCPREAPSESVKVVTEAASTQAIAKTTNVAYGGAIED